MIKCKVCNKEFEKINRYKLYCSIECRQTCYKVSAVCIICEKEFQASKYNIGRFCSNRCSLIAQKGRR